MAYIPGTFEDVRHRHQAAGRQRQRRGKLPPRLSRAVPSEGVGSRPEGRAGVRSSASGDGRLRVWESGSWGARVPEVRAARGVLRPGRTGSLRSSGPSAGARDRRTGALRGEGGEVGDRDRSRTSGYRRKLCFDHDLKLLPGPTSARPAACSSSWRFPQRESVFAESGAPFGIFASHHMVGPTREPAANRSLTGDHDDEPQKHPVPVPPPRRRSGFGSRHQESDPRHHPFRPSDRGR